MQLIHTISELRSWRRGKEYTAFIPTMGNLHEGHLQLVREAKKVSDHIVVSIFVNPLQFGENEDFDRYPRTVEADTKKLFDEGVSVVFLPEVSEIYPQEQTCFIEPSPIQNLYCGVYRPNHFKGVATVVAKLFCIIQPDVVVFGKKDYQQLFIIKEMVANFNTPIQIIAVDTIRTEDGLALSTRNSYLSEVERIEAPRLFQELSKIKQAILTGEYDYAVLVAKATQHLSENGWDVQYITICNKNTLLPAESSDKQLIILAAAYLGNTRLIDNIEVTRP